MKRTMIAIIAVLFAAVPTPSRGQAVPLDELLAAADTGNAELASARRRAEAARARVPQAGALPDPMLGVGLMNVPAADPGLSSDMMTMTQVQFGAVLPWPGKLRSRENVARLEADAAAWYVDGVRDRIVADVKAAYYRLYFLDRAMAVTRRNETLVADFADLTSAKYGVGTGVQSDVLKAQVERTGLADQFVALRQQRESTAAHLNALLGRPAGTPVPAAELPESVRVAALAPPDASRFASAALADVVAAKDVGGPLPPEQELQALALAANPMIQAHARRVAAREEAVVLARSAKLPDVNLTAGYSRRAGRGDFVNVMISAPLPVFSGRKQDQAVIEADAVLEEHRARHRAMVDDLDAEIASLSGALRRAREQLVLLNDGILPQARTGLSSAAAAYQVGRVDFLTLLDAQVTLYRHELDYHRLLADFAQNLAALERAVGTEVLR